jgi:hypothetical protein
MELETKNLKKKLFLDEGKIVELYKNGDSQYSLAKEFKTTPTTIKRILILNNIEIRKSSYDYSHRKKHKVELDKLIQLVKKNHSIDEISNYFGVHHETIRYYLFTKLKKLPKVYGFNEKEKQIIINQYVNEKRGAKHIGKLLNKSDLMVSFWLKKWGIKKITRSEISKKIREIYGATKGFTGKSHSKKSKEAISKSGLKSWKDSNREPKISKSRTYVTTLGKVLGTYEVAYLQQLYMKKESLPMVNKKKIKTPYGTYTPDFEFENRFIEVKSDFTFKVANGEFVIKNYVKQIEKINWVNLNIKPIEIVIINKKDAKNLFLIAKSNNFDFKNNEYGT